MRHPQGEIRSKETGGQQGQEIMETLLFQYFYLALLIGCKITLEGNNTDLCYHKEKLELLLLTETEIIRKFGRAAGLRLNGEIKK